MARVKAGLLSLGASGEFGNLIEFRMTSHGQQAIPIRRKTNKRSAAQANQANRFKAATAAWNGLGPEQKEAWNTAAEGTGKIGYRLYLSEYMNQGIQPPEQPQMP